MKISSRLLYVFATSFVLVTIALATNLINVSLVSAAPAPVDGNDSSGDTITTEGSVNKYTVYKCTSSGLSIPKCEKEALSTTPVKPTSENNPIMAWLTFFVNLFSVIIVAGGAVMIAVAGVQYTASRDNAQATQAAKQKIFNVVVGLLMYVFFYGFMQWLIPGGVF